MERGLEVARAHPEGDVQAVKVRAHRCLQDIASPTSRAHAEGNHLADALATRTAAAAARALDQVGASATRLRALVRDVWSTVGRTGLAALRSPLCKAWKKRRLPVQTAALVRAARHDACSVEATVHQAWAKRRRLCPFSAMPPGCQAWDKAVMQGAMSSWLDCSTHIHPPRLSDVREPVTPGPTEHIAAATQLSYPVPARGNVLRNSEGRPVPPSLATPPPPRVVHASPSEGILGGGGLAGICPGPPVPAYASSFTHSFSARRSHSHLSSPALSLVI